MVLCSRCKKRPAVVFITSMHGNEKKNEGLCLMCAKEMNIPQVADYMSQLGISDDDLEQMSDQMMELFDGDSFEMGGAGTLPPYIQNLLDGHLGGVKASDSDELPSEKKKESKSANVKNDKKRKNTELKFLEN